MIGFCPRSTLGVFHVLIFHQYEARSASDMLAGFDKPRIDFFVGEQMGTNIREEIPANQKYWLKYWITKEKAVTPFSM